MLTVPMVVEQNGRAERAFDIYSLLLRNRIVMLGTQVTSQSANLIVAQLLFLDGEDPDKRIQMYVNSPGGEVYAGLAMYDAMQDISAPVSTVAVGLAASFGTVILTGGAAGMRYALPHATIHMHQPHGGTQGQVTDMDIMVTEYNRLKRDLIEIFMKHTGKDYETIERDMDRDRYLSPKQAAEYGLIDEVLTRKELKALEEKA
ncbi:MAG: ATP-dependent Clp protease proteolytic subunit [Anaerolineae bacterium]|nr:ATP-dependent Clp protease proteolytic subunit [Anaerolineae bacterium]